VAADGTAYGFNNNRSVDRVLQLMDKSITSFRSSPPAKVALDGSLESEPFAPTPPAGGIVLRTITRIKPAPLGCDSANENVARDHFWVPKEEGVEIANLQIPESFKYRLARFAFVDNIRGEPDFWKVEEIKNCDLSVKRLPSYRNRTYAISGPFRMQTSDLRRGYEGTFEGEVAIDLQGNVTAFKAFASGQAWGAGTYAPNPPPGKFPLLIAFSKVDDEMSRTVAPQAAFFGREYITGK
jgi:hypothetical protein